MKRFALIPLVMATSVLAAEGNLDPGYGTAGLAKVDTASLGNTAVSGTIGARGPSGSTYTLSSIYILPSDTQQLVIARRSYSGQPDTSFGNGTGMVVTNFSPISSKFFPHDAIPTDDGGLVVAGMYYDGQTDLDIRICRFNIDGTFDTAFGGLQTGCRNLSLPPKGADPVLAPEDRRVALTRWPQGGYMIASTVEPSPNQPAKGMLTRLTANGIPDVGFGTNGDLLLTSNNIDVLLHDIAVDANGNMAVAGTVQSGITYSELGLYLLPNGGVIWGVSGGATPRKRFTNTAFFPDGSVLFGGAVDTGISQPDQQFEGLLQQYTIGGTALPSTFAPGGRFTLCNSICTKQKVADIQVQKDGKVLLTGPVEIANLPGNTDFYAVRLNADLSVDPDFTNNFFGPGIGYYSFDPLNPNELTDATARIYQAKGHVFIVGQHAVISNNNLVTNPAIARLDNSDVIFQDGFDLFD